MILHVGVGTGSGHIQIIGWFLWAERYEKMFNEKPKPNDLTHLNDVVTACSLMPTLAHECHPLFFPTM
jgi:hypothetical protein